jgi:chromosome segregation protein
LEGFNLTYRSLNEQAETETDKKIRLEAVVANEEAELEQEKVGFIEKERALQSMQVQFNELLQQTRTKENERNLASQRLNFLKEKEQNLQDFLNKSEGQLKGLEESIQFTELQVEEEKGKLDGLQEQLEALKDTVDENRKIFDAKRSHVDTLRSENLAIQRNQFDAEKKVAVADTSIQNLQQAIQRMEEEREVRNSQLKQVEKKDTAGRKNWRQESNNCVNSRNIMNKLRNKFFKPNLRLRVYVSNLLKKAASWMQRRMNMTS